MTRSKQLVLVLTLLAFSLRAYRLDVQSLWSDEGLSLYRARLSLSENLSNVIVVPPGVSTQDTNPPLYFILLSGLCAAAGESEYALRFLSVMAGVLLVPLLYVSARRLFSERAGVLSAALAALSPFLVWYSQEARMYTLLAALSTASVYLLLRALSLRGASRLQDEQERLRASRRAAWLVWAAVTAAGLYTHFVAFFVLLFECAVVLVVVAWRRRRDALLAAALVILAAVPATTYALSRAAVNPSPASGFRTLDSIVEELLGTFGIGWSNNFFQPLWAVLPALGLLIVGAFGGRLQRPRHVFGGLFTLAWLLIVLMAFYVATFIQPLYTGPRHLLLLALPFYLLVGNGLALAWRRSRLVGVASLGWMVVSMAVWLGVQFFDSTYTKQDIRSVAMLIAKRAAAGDVVIVHDAVTSFVFDYYYDGAAPWAIIPTYPSHEVSAALAEFQARAEAADRLWFITEPPPLSGFDRQALDVWARGHLLRLDHQRFSALWLGSEYQLYTAHYPVLDALPGGAKPMDVTWDTGLRLVGVADVTGQLPPPTAAGSSHLALFWRQDRRAQGNYVTTFRLVDPSGDERLRQRGTIFDNWSARQWPVGKIVRQDVTFDLPPDLPPGVYDVWLALAERASEEVILTVDGEGDVAIGSLALPGEPVNGELTNP